LKRGQGGRKRRKQSTDSQGGFKERGLASELIAEVTELTHTILTI